MGTITRALAVDAYLCNAAKVSLSGNYIHYGCCHQEKMKSGNFDKNAAIITCSSQCAVINVHRNTCKLLKGAAGDFIFY